MARKLRREQQYEENMKRMSSPDKEFTPGETSKLVSAFKKKAERRMKGFYEESQRIDKKVPELIAKAKSMGVNIHAMTINSYDIDSLNNFRKKTKNLSFSVSATRDDYKLSGTLNITPASMRLVLNCNDLPSVKTKSGWGLPLFSISYYRTLNVRDNYLGALVGGGYKAVANVEETEEIPF